MRADLERITINLTPRSQKALASAMKLSDDSKTDVMNRAIVMLAYCLERDGELFIRRPDGETEKLVLL